MDSYDIIAGEVETLLDEHKAQTAGDADILQDALQGRDLLMVDADFGLSANNLSTHLNNARAMGLGRTADLIVERLFYGTTPRDVTDVFRSFLGGKQQLRTRRVHESPTHVDRPLAGVIFSGSPACVTNVAHGETIHGLDIRITDAEVYSSMTGIHDQLITAGIPGVGVCFGHQFISSRSGAQVVKMPATRKGIEVIQSSPNGAQIVQEGFGSSVDKGALYVSHNDCVVPDPKHSVTFLATNDSIVHGLVSNKGIQFSGDSKSDASLVRDALASGQRFDLTMQAHPELTMFYLLLEAMKRLCNGRDIQSLDIPGKIKSLRSVFKSMVAFLGAHKNTQPN